MAGPKKLLFASDVHWRPTHEASDLQGDPFCAFLRWAGECARQGEVSSLYIVGDLFDVWYESRGRALSGYAHHAAALAAATRAGLQVHLLFGNRDFMYRTALPKAAGVELLGDRAELNLDGRKVLLHHGDLFCTRDRSYQIFRRCIRSLPIKILASALSFRMIEQIMAQMAAASIQSKKRKGFDATAIVEENVLREHGRGFSTVICGHVHKADRRQLDRAHPDWELITLGPWEGNRGSYLEYDGAFHLKEFIPD